jgi:hypothetical protein
MPAAPGATLGSAAQSCPHVPQFLASDCKFTQLAEHGSAEGGEQASLHLAPLAVLEQRGVDPEHAVPQPPQFFESERSVSHPSSGREEQ